MAGIVVVLGNSRAGKDTVASFMPLYNIKFSAPVKRQVEQALNLPLLCTDDENPDRNCKAKTLPLLKEAFKHGQWVQKHIWMPQMVRYADEVLTEGKGVVFTDIRTSAERDAVINLADSHSLTINTLVIHRDNSEALETDNNLSWLITDFKYVSSLSADIVNNGSFKELKERVNDLYSVML
ncbi:Phosphomevalonate kinase [Arthronema virus TR020]|uniref:Phosphomevalonate kinase n=1 Tax=Arthronema virus TR020 TaxID=2736280 RepID=A0A7G3WH43_9CAUD|nr:Phosphomevalonate kinase [Arthronema virus TR020]